MKKKNIGKGTQTSILKWFVGFAGRDFSIEEVKKTRNGQLYE